MALLIALTVGVAGGLLTIVPVESQALTLEARRAPEAVAGDGPVGPVWVGAAEPAPAGTKLWKANRGINYIDRTAVQCLGSGATAKLVRTTWQRRLLQAAHCPTDQPGPAGANRQSGAF